MRPALRYTISTGVGLVVTVLVLLFATSDHLVILSLFPLYGVVTSMILAHKQQWLSLGGTGQSARIRTGTIGGIGAFTGSLLLQTSLPAGLAGLGLMLLGMAGTIGYVDEA